MLFSIAANERAALQFDDLASAIDAGLPMAAIGGNASDGDRVLHGALRQRGVRLTATEDTVIVHAWRAGRAATALRARAAERRQRAEFARTIWAGLRYPALLFVMILVTTSVLTVALGSTSLLYWVLGLYAAAALAWFLLRAALRRDDPRVAKVPIVGRIVAGLGELPYLETLHALYASGVQLAPAHAAAVAAVPTGIVRQRLVVADGILQSGRPLAEALDQSVALHPETRTLLTTGERAGQLEDALKRALDRRRDVVGRDIASNARRIGQAAYFIAVVIIVGLILNLVQALGGLYSTGRR